MSIPYPQSSNGGSTWRYPTSRTMDARTSGLQSTLDCIPKLRSTKRWRLCITATRLDRWRIEIWRNLQGRWKPHLKAREPEGKLISNSNLIVIEIRKHVEIHHNKNSWPEPYEESALTYIRRFQFFRPLTIIAWNKRTDEQSFRGPAACSKFYRGFGTRINSYRWVVRTDDTLTSFWPFAILWGLCWGDGPSGPVVEVSVKLNKSERMMSVFFRWNEWRGYQNVKSQR